MPYIEAQDILDKTNGGLDIILELYPDAAKSVSDPNRKFKTRDEKTASAKLNRTTEGVYLVIDFGDDQQNRNGINAFALENKITYTQALQELAIKHNIVAGESKLNRVSAVYSDAPAAPDQPEGSWDFKLDNKWSDFQIESIISTEVLKYLGWFKEEKKQDAYSKIAGKLKYYHWHPVVSYTYIKDRKELTFSATDEYPIYLIDEGTHKKLYQPKHSDKGKRFMYAPGTGQKPKDFIHGYSQLNKAYVENMNRVDNEDQEGDEEDGKKSKKKKKNYKLPEVILCTGGSDAINVALCGYHVIWLNSESAKISNFQYDQLSIWVEIIYQISDLDRTGKKQAHILAMEYLDIFNIELPEELLVHRDSRGYPCKDLRDYFNHYKIKDFKILVKDAMPYRFWERKANYDRSGEFRGFDYVFDNEQGYNFLQKNGFYRLPVGDKSNEFAFVRIEGNVVRYSNANDIREFLKNFMRSRYLDKDLRNAIYRSAQLNESSLTNLDKTEITFSDCDKDRQFMFFKNVTLEVTAAGILRHKPGAVDRYIWEDEVHDHRFILPEQEPFTITKNHLDVYNIEIQNKDCYLLKFLVQTSRIHWRTELEDRLEAANMTPLEREEYAKEHKFNIAGDLLTDDEKAEQIQHLVNKIFTIGYLMHRYKDRSKPWFIFAMDGKVSDDGQSHGGSGKSIIYDMAMRRLLKRNFWLSGRNPKLAEEQFRYDGLTEHDRYLLVDDAHKYLDLDVFYTDITGDLKANIKGKTSITIPFDKSAKFVFTSNYTPRNLGPSTIRRMIYSVFSDYYHNASEMTDYRESRDPNTEFGKNMFTEFNEKEFNDFYVASAYCLRFYLSTTGKVEPAMSNVSQRNLMTEMGTDFHDWAMAFFAEGGGNVDKKIVREVAFKDFTHNTPGKFTPQSFWNKLKAFCKINGYVLNPKTMVGKKGKILEKVDKQFYDPKTNIWTTLPGPKDTKELIYIQTLNEIPKGINPEIPTEATTIQLSTDQTTDFPI